MTNLPQSPTGRFIAYLEQGQLAYQVDDAGRPVFPPRIGTANGHDLQWKISAGRGSVYATSVVYRKDEAPLNVVLVDMDEGFRLMSRVEGMEPESVRIGMRVRFVVGEPTGSGPRFPLFVADRA